MKELKRGIYRHYKGDEYLVLDEALSSDTKEELIIYKSLKDGKVWTREKEEFLEHVETEEGEKPRFEFIRDNDEDSWETKYLRALADYQNLVRQNEKSKQDFIKYAISDFLQDLLPVYDHLKLSLKGLSEEEKNSAWAIGVRHVLKQFKEILENKGVEEIKTVGEKFDHNTMEAVGGEGAVVDKEMMPGYKLNGRVVKPAKVIVK